VVDVSSNGGWKLNFKRILHRFLAGILILAFVASDARVYAQGLVPLPAPGTRVALSPAFIPPLLKGIKVYRNDPFRFDFILDKGDQSLSTQPLSTGGHVAPQGNVSPSILPSELALNPKATQGSSPTPSNADANRLIKYFLAALTVPEKDLWVNLSPYEKDRIVPEEFGQTEMGRDLLAQDYILKQLTASVIYPDDKAGQEFWAKVYAAAEEKYGTTDVPVDTFNKVWIVPEKATVYENKDAAFVLESKLKVMLESDYTAMSNNPMPTRGHVAPQGNVSPSRLPTDQPLNVQATQGPTPTTSTSELTKQILREIIIPILEKEVNEGKNFAQLRQVYNSLILATWYKRKIKASIMAQAYVDKKKVSGIGYALPARGHVAPQGNVSPSTLPSELPLNAKATEGTDRLLSTASVIHTDLTPEKIWSQYVESFKKGAFNFIREETNPATQEVIPRKYFSGGANFNMDMAEVFKIVDFAELPSIPAGRADIVRMKAEVRVKEDVVKNSPEAQVYLYTSKGRNKDVIDLITSSRFSEAVGMDLKNSSPLVIDMGIGFPPVTTIEMKDALKKLNPKVRVMGMEVTPATARAQLVFREGKIFDALKDIVGHDVEYGKNIEDLFEISFVVTDSGTKMHQGVSDIVLKRKNASGEEEYRDLKAPEINLQYLQREVGAFTKHRLLDVALFKHLFLCVSRYKTIDLLSKRSQWEQDPNAVLEENPVQNLLMSNGIGFVESDNFEKTIAVESADVVVASNVVIHLNKEQRDKFVQDVSRVLKENRILVVKNVDAPNDVSRIDVYRKNHGLLVYVGSLLSGIDSKGFLDDRHFSGFVLKKKTILPVLMDEEIKYLYRDLLGEQVRASGDWAMINDLGVRSSARKPQDVEAWLNEPQQDGIDQEERSDFSQDTASFWDWNEVTLDQVDREFDAWVQSDQMDSGDLKILREILSGDENILQELLKDLPGKVEIKAEDREMPEKDGRTVYLRLKKSFVSAKGDIKILRIKGARPRYKDDPSIIESHTGNGFVYNPIEVNERGNPELKYIPKVPETSEWEPVFLKPQGAMLKEQAELEYQIMEAGKSGQGFETDYPVAAGSWKNKMHAGRQAGFVIAGMRAEDVRIEIVPYMNIHPQLIDVMSGRSLFGTPPDVIGQVYTMIGETMRAYHDAGYFHRYPHQRNWGVETGLRTRVIIRDLDTTIKREAISGKSSRRIEATYRLLDLERIITDLSWRGEAFFSLGTHGSRTSDIIYSNVKCLLKGYFPELRFDSPESLQLLSDITSRWFPAFLSNYVKDGNKVVLTRNKHIYGAIWKHLYDLTPVKKASVVNSGVDVREHVREDQAEIKHSQRVLPGLTEEEKSWILKRNLTRMDGEDVILRPWGAEQARRRSLFEDSPSSIREYFNGKDVLVIPGYANNGFLLAEQGGASSVTVYDKDPVTIAWLKAIKQYYHWPLDNGRSIGEAFVQGANVSKDYFILAIQKAVQGADPERFAWDKSIEFYVGDVDRVLKDQNGRAFDTVFVPYLLGVNRGVENEADITYFVEQLIKIAPAGKMLVTPSGDRPYVYSYVPRGFFIKDLPVLSRYFVGGAHQWHGSFGMAVFDFSLSQEHYKNFIFKDQQEQLAHLGLKFMGQVSEEMCGLIGRNSGLINPDKVYRGLRMSVESLRYVLRNGMGASRFYDKNHPLGATEAIWSAFVIKTWEEYPMDDENFLTAILQYDREASEYSTLPEAVWLYNKKERKFINIKDQPNNFAMNAREVTNGGIDFNADKLNIQTKSGGDGIEFNIDPAMLAQLQNASGVTPVIIDMQPLDNLSQFMGVQ
jgi:hypothetical protein